MMMMMTQELQIVNYGSNSHHLQHDWHHHYQGLFPDLHHSQYCQFLFDNHLITFMFHYLRFVGNFFIDNFNKVVLASLFNVAVKKS